MASEITSFMMEVGDMPESSRRRKTQDMTINESSLRNLLECVTQMLQQILMVQRNPQQMRKEDLEPAMVLSKLPVGVVEEFEAHLSSSNCDGLLEMVNEFPAQLFLQTFDKYYCRSALHVAIMEGSQTLIGALVKKLKALPSSSDSKLDEHDFILKEDDFGLSAAHMAALIGNKETISCFELHLEVFDYIEGENPSHPSPTSENKKRDLLEKAFPLLEKQAPTSSDQDTCQLSIREWLLMNDIDFVYCLHQGGDSWGLLHDKVIEFVEHVCNNGDSSFLEPLFNVRDSLGKSPFHSCNLSLLRKLVAHFPNIDWNTPDFCGRTPLHWAAGQGDSSLVNFLASQRGIDLNATYTTAIEIKVKQNTDFNYDLVQDVTPLHLAVIHNHVEVVEALLKVPKEQGLDVNAICIEHDKCPRTPFQFAAFKGHEQILRVFLKDSRVYDPGFKNVKESDREHHYRLPALHLAASQFHPSALKALVDCTKIDTLVKDLSNNTALHYAAMHTHGRVQIHANLNEYVTLFHFNSNPPISRKPSDHDIITCIDILMQSGLDMEQRNKDGTTPTLHPSCPERVQTWWLQKMAKKAQENKNNLIVAANAVSVTAALVATASFVGPLQPPLGLLDDGNQTWLDGYSQVQHISVQVFLFCDSLSFYFAIAAIVFAMLPSWSIPHEGLGQEVRIARRCVQVAVLLLFGSILFVVCAFSAASFAIVPDQRWRYKTIAVISTSLGVLICFLILFLSFMRLLTLISSKNEVAKKISNVATRIMLWE